MRAYKQASAEVKAPRIESISDDDVKQFLDQELSDIAHVLDYLKNK